MTLKPGDRVQGKTKKKSSNKRGEIVNMEEKLGKRKMGTLCNDDTTQVAVPNSVKKIRTIIPATGPPLQVPLELEMDEGDDSDSSISSVSSENEVDSVDDLVNNVEIMGNNAEPKAMDELLHPNGTPWELIDSVEVETIPDIYGDDSTLNWCGRVEAEAGDVKRRVEYFYKLFPMNQLDAMVEGTNESLLGGDQRNVPVTSAELLRFIGIWATVALEKRRGSVDEWFRGGTVEESVLTYGNYHERFGMRISRFEALSSSLNLRPAPVSEEHKADKWYKVREFIASFNTNRKAFISLGQYLVVDDLKVVSHVLKARKPEGIGCEFKSVVDPSSGIIMHLEVQEGTLAMHQKEYCEEYGTSTACTLRMTRDWHGTGRTVIGGSWFGSYRNAKALRGVGLYSMFLVKTAHEHYPSKYLKNWYDQDDQHRTTDGQHIPRGNWKCLRNVSSEGYVFHALGYRDRKLKTLITNKGTTLPGDPLIIDRSRVAYDEDGRPVAEWYQKETPRCNMIQKYFDHFSCIDVNDHRRQGVFNIEKFWLTKKWWHRVFATVGIGICFVDAYLAYKMEWEANYVEEVEDFTEFAGHVAHALIFNDYIDRRASARRQQVRRTLQGEAPPDGKHYLRPIKTHPKYIDKKMGRNTRAKLRCCKCGKTTSYYCIQCTTDEKIIALCNPWPSVGHQGPLSTCFYDHY